MKKILFMAAAASLAFAACSKDDAGAVVTPEMTTTYAKVSISMPAPVGTRAFGSDFDAGTVDEAALEVENIMLLLYDEAGLLVGTGEHVATELDEKFVIASDRSGTESVSDKGNVVFKLTLSEGAPLPTQVVAYVNPKVTPKFDLTDLTITANQVEDITSGDTKKYFVMTSAGHFDDETGAYTVAAKLNQGEFYTTVSGATAATEQAADIYVERLAAKVSVSEKDGGADQSAQKFVIITPEKKQLTPTFNTTNWGITGTADKMYLLKKPFAKIGTWTAGTNRTFWAEGVYWGLDYDKYVDNLTYIANNDLTVNMGKEDYTLEHTYNYAAIKDEPLFNPAIPSTSALVKGTYSFEGDGASDYTGGFYLLFAGTNENDQSVYTIYNKDELIEYIKGRKEGATAWVKEDGTEVTSFDIVKVEGKFQLIEKDDETNAQLYYDTFAVGNEVPTTNARHYVDSEGYFFVPIEHNTSEAEANGYYGVVRNHSYVLTINKINGLAAPMDDDYTGEEGGDTPIVPDPEDLKEAYIQASINVLSWHVVNQGVEL